MAYAHVQTNHIQDGNSSTHSISLTGTTAGNMLTLAIDTFQSGGADLTVPAGWTRVVRSAVLNNSVRVEIWVSPNIAGGNVTVAINPSAGASYVSAALSEWSGGATTTPQDQSNSTIQSVASANPSSGNVTTTTAGELYLGVLATVNNRTMTLTSSGWTDRYNGPTGVNQPIDYGSNGESSSVAAGTYAATWTLSSSDAWAACIATFLPGAGGGGGGALWPWWLYQSSPLGCGAA